MLKPVQSAPNAQQFITVPYGQVTITVKANGGTVDIAMLHDDATGTWVPAIATINADSAQALFPGPNARLRITAAGGATFTIHGPGF